MEKMIVSIKGVSTSSDMSAEVSELVFLFARQRGHRAR